ncbi:MAG: phage NinH family protein, partial [Chloroflexi bacterium]|nr:phage NinH family protein [Chloroflexota bacterium]
KASPVKLGRPESYSVTEVIEAIEEAHGLITHAARRLGCRPGTLREYADRHAEIAQALWWERERRKDRAESALDKALEAGEGWATCFTLKCLAKDRGYIETGRLELTGRDGAPLAVQINWVAPAQQAVTDGDDA